MKPVNENNIRQIDWERSVVSKDNSQRTKNKIRFYCHCIKLDLYKSFIPIFDELQEK